MDSLAFSAAVAGAIVNTPSSRPYPQSGKGRAGRRLLKLSGFVAELRCYKSVDLIDAKAS